MKIRKGDFNIAVVGSGYWGRNLVRVFNELGCLSSVCDCNNNLLSDIKKKYPHIKINSKFSGILNDKEINAVVISLPAEMHYSYAKETILSGKDVFVEKPLALNHIEANELMKLAEERNKIIMVGHLMQYHPAFIKLKELVNAGELGRIQYLYSNRLNLGKIRREENILWSFAPHDISMIISLVNTEPDSVFTTGGYYLNKRIADVTITYIDFPNDIKSHIFVSWLHPYKKQELVVVGGKRMAVFDDTKPWSEKLLIYPHELNWENGFPIPYKKDAKKVIVKESEPLKNECEHFVDCLLNRTSPLTDGKEALSVLKVLELSQKSLDEKRIVYMKTFLKRPKNNDDYFVHKSSYVDKNAKIGKGTKIWHFSHIMSGAVVGENCSIGQNVSVGSKAIIGNNVKIQNNVSIYDEVILEDEVFCGPSCVFTNVINPRAFISRKHEFKKTLVRKGATIGANATIICGNRIGEYSFIGAGAVVTKNVKPYALVTGNPAKQIGWVCKCGDKLEFKDKVNLKCVCGKKYKLTNDKLIER